MRPRLKPRLPASASRRDSISPIPLSAHPAVAISPASCARCSTVGITRHCSPCCACRFRDSARRPQATASISSCASVFPARASAARHRRMFRRGRIASGVRRLARTDPLIAAADWAARLKNSARAAARAGRSPTACHASKCTSGVPRPLLSMPSTRRSMQSAVGARCDRADHACAQFWRQRRSRALARTAARPRPPPQCRPCSGCFRSPPMGAARGVRLRPDGAPLPAVSSRRSSCSTTRRDAAPVSKRPPICRRKSDSCLSSPSLARHRRNHSQLRALQRKRRRHAAVVSFSPASTPASCDARASAPASFASCPRADAPFHTGRRPARPAWRRCTRLCADFDRKFPPVPFQFFAARTLRLRARPPAPRDRLDVLVQGSILASRAGGAGSACRCSARPYSTRSLPTNAAAPAFRRLTAPKPCAWRLVRHFEAFLADRQVTARLAEPRRREIQLPVESAARHPGPHRPLDVSPRKQALVIDYKYSAGDKIRERVEENAAGNLVQGGLYLLAAEQAVRSGARGHAVLRAAQGSRVGRLARADSGSRSDRRGVRARNAARSDGRGRGQSRGGLRSDRVGTNCAASRPTPDKCQWCDFRDICRVETIAAARKAARVNLTARAAGRRHTHRAGRLRGRRSRLRQDARADRALRLAGGRASASTPRASWPSRSPKKPPPKSRSA